MSWPVDRPIGDFGAGRRTTLGDIQSCGRAKVALSCPPRWFTPIGTSLEVALRIALEGGIGKGDPALCSPKITSMVQSRWIGHEEKMIFTGSALVIVCVRTASNAIYLEGIGPNDQAR